MNSKIEWTKSCLIFSKWHQICYVSFCSFSFLQNALAVYLTSYIKCLPIPYLKVCMVQLSPQKMIGVFSNLKQMLSITLDQSWSFFSFWKGKVGYLTLSFHDPVVLCSAREYSTTGKQWKEKIGKENQLHGPPKAQRAQLIWHPKA